MAIHHDKHAYGNLEKLNKDMDENSILKMLSSLKPEEEEKKEEKEENVILEQNEK